VTPTPYFSVIIPVYNRTALLAPCLRSLFAQECQDFETIVVDDGSTEDLAPAVGPFAGRIKLLRQRNRGPGAARNLGIRQATGRYVAFLDSDDLWFPWTLAIYRQALEQHGRPAFLKGKGFDLATEGNQPTERQPAPEIRSFPDALAAVHVPQWLGAAAFVVRSDVLGGVGGFAGRRMNAEDIDLALRLGTAPGFILVESPATFAVRLHESNVTRQLALLERGVRHLLRRERRGVYPGGAARRAERRAVLLPLVVWYLARCARERPSWGWPLYFRTLPWMLRQGQGVFAGKTLLRRAWTACQRTGRLVRDCVCGKPTAASAGGRP